MSNTEPRLIYVTKRDGEDCIDLECRFSDGQKFAAVQIDSNFPELAEKIYGFLNNSVACGQKPVLDKVVDLGILC